MMHLVNRLEFEANYSDEEQAFNMRHNFAQTIQLQIASVIDKVCSQYVPDNEWIQIDKVEIDMGQLDPNAFDTEFEKIFLYRFEKELTAKLSGKPAAERKSSVHQSMFGLLTHFLKKGVLPWWAGEDAISLEEVCKDVFTNSEKLMEQFFLQQVNNVTVWQRAAFQLTDDAKRHIVQMLKVLEAAKEIINKMLITLTERVSALTGEQKTAIIKKLQWQTNKMDDLIIANAPAIFVAENNSRQVKITGADAFLKLFTENPADLELVKIELHRILDGIEKAQTANDKIKEDSEAVKTGTASKEVKDDSTDFGNITALKKNIPQITDNEEGDKTGTEKLMIKGAGIILLAPFLKPFFTKLKLIQGNEWVNIDAQVKAVYLLKYLGNGTQLCQEYQLILEKLLCGIPVHEPIEKAPEFTQVETDEADELLHSVLEHWQRLKNTSVNGLRESFFKRDGILTAKENNWHLLIERKTMDVLLDSIPWGFSNVSLPWNEYIIFTEW